MSNNSVIYELIRNPRTKGVRIIPRKITMRTNKHLRLKGVGHLLIIDGLSPIKGRVKLKHYVSTKKTAFDFKKTIAFLNDSDTKISTAMIGIMVSVCVVYTMYSLFRPIPALNENNEL